MSVQDILRLRIAALVAVCVCIAPTSGAASTATSQLSVTATVVPGNSCSITSSGYAFPGFAGSTLTATMTGLLQANCTSGAPYSISADTGLNGTHASGTTRAMSSAGHYISYELYVDSGRTQVWNTSNVLSGTGTGAAQSITAYGMIPAQTVPIAGTYSDTVTATISF